MIDTIDDDVCRYLSAVDAVAIYVATVDGMPTRVGFAHDPRKTRLFLARRWPAVSFGWLAWFDGNKYEASSFIEEISNNAAELIHARPLASVILHIESIAVMEGVTLTPHASAVERAKAASSRINQAFAMLQAAGELTAFNRAYRAYHHNRRSNRESALPFWAAKDALRRLVIRHLADHDGFFLPTVLSEIRQHFPWFRGDDKGPPPYHKPTGA